MTAAQRGSAADCTMCAGRRSGGCHWPALSPPPLGASVGLL